LRPCRTVGNATTHADQATRTNLANRLALFYKGHNRLACALTKRGSAVGVFPDSSTVEQPAVNRFVVGSSPTRGAFLINNGRSAVAQLLFAWDRLTGRERHFDSRDRLRRVRQFPCISCRHIPPGFAQEMRNERVRHANPSLWRTRQLAQYIGITGLMPITGRVRHFATGSAP
jgi:hypothetical protein